MKRLFVPAAALALAAVAVTLATAAGPQISGGLVGAGVLTYRTTNVQLSAEKGFVMEWAKVPAGQTFG